jgi:hypothetical protein
MRREETLARLTRSLENHCPEGTSAIIARWVLDLAVDFKITPGRKTKLGDFRPPHGAHRARITVNGDLNEYNFLITTIHEFAHLGCFLKHGVKVAPHGREWKAIYAELLGSFLGNGTFPPDLEVAIRTHLANPSASSCASPALSKALAKFDESPSTFLDDLPLNTKFYFNHREFINLTKKRTRFLCFEPKSGRNYLISGRAKVSLKHKD